MIKGNILLRVVALYCLFAVQVVNWILCDVPFYVNGHELFFFFRTEQQVYENSSTMIFTEVSSWAKGLKEMEYMNNLNWKFDLHFKLWEGENILIYIGHFDCYSN